MPQDKYVLAMLALIIFLAASNGVNGSIAANVSVDVAYSVDRVLLIIAGGLYVVLNAYFVLRARCHRRMKAKVVKQLIELSPEQGDYIHTISRTARVRAIQQRGVCAQASMPGGERTAPIAVM